MQYNDSGKQNEVKIRQSKHFTNKGNMNERSRHIFQERKKLKEPK